MLGAMIGDIAGSVYEFRPYLSSMDISLEDMLKDENASFTDDTVLTIAVADGLMEANKNEDLGVQAAIKNSFVKWTAKYPNAGYGGYFFNNWVYPGDHREPTMSYGNGAAMRISPVGWLKDISEEECLYLSQWVTTVTHTHPAAIYGAQIIATAIHDIVCGAEDTEDTLNYIANKFGIDEILTKDISEISTPKQNNINCTKAAIQALIAVRCSNSFEETVLNAIHIGGDTDTVGAIAGSVAEALYPERAAQYRSLVEKKVPAEFLEVIDEYHRMIEE